MPADEAKGHQRAVHEKPYEAILYVQSFEGSPETGRYYAAPLVTYPICGAD